MKELKVNDEHRTNELSLSPGGSIIKILHDDGRILVYDKIKNPNAYIKRALKDESVSKIWCDEVAVWPKELPKTSHSVL
jgi:hypothetical protein